MTNPGRRGPWQELASLRDNMNRILEEGIAAVGGGATLALDIYETSDAVIVEAGPIAGIAGEDIEVSITNNVLTIQGETKYNVDIDDSEILDDVLHEILYDLREHYLRKERRFGAFSRSVTIPRPVKAEEAVAKFKNGILTITIPKAEEARPRVIDIKATDS